MKNQLTADGAGGQSATIAWLGYRTPRMAALEPNLEVTGSGLASTGADQLRGFLHQLSGLTNSHNITIVGHSYGTEVVSMALARMAASRSADLSNIRSAVFAGSPWLPEDPRGSAGRLYSVQAPNDMIAGGQEFATSLVGGVNAYNTPGIAQFAANAAGFKSISGHTSYFDQGSASLANIASVVEGNYGAVIQ